MSRKKVIVKRLNAIQNFGAMDVLCTDKTGTLTQDRIILKRHLDIQGNDSERLASRPLPCRKRASGCRRLMSPPVCTLFLAGNDQLVVVKADVMPGYPFLKETEIDTTLTTDHLRTLRSVGVPYTDDEIANAVADLNAQANPDDPSAR
jgi:magnesium-transporting ATPase (P-type)